MDRTTTIIHPFYMSETEWYVAMDNISTRAEQAEDLLSKVNKSYGANAVTAFSFAYDSYTTWDSSKGMNWLEFIVFGEFAMAYNEYKTLAYSLRGLAGLPIGYSMSDKIESLANKIKEKNPKRSDIEENEEYIWSNLWNGDLVKEIISKEFDRSLCSPSRCIGLYTEMILEEMLNGVLHRLEIRESLKN